MNNYKNTNDFKNKYFKYKKKYLQLKAMTKFEDLPDDVLLDVLSFKSCEDVMNFRRTSRNNRNLVEQNILHIGLRLNIFEENEFKLEKPGDYSPNRKFVEKDTNKRYNINQLYQEFVRRCYEKIIISIKINETFKEELREMIKNNQIDITFLVNINKGIDQLKEKGITGPLILKILKIVVNNTDTDTDIIGMAIQLKEKGITGPFILGILKIVVKNKDINIIGTAIQLKEKGMDDYYILKELE